MLYFFKRTFPLVKFLVLALIVLGVTVLLVTLARGYIFNPETRQFEAGGLLMLGSSPSRAAIFINGDPNGTTPNRLLLNQGYYTVELHRQGYRQWQKNVRLRENEVLWTRYPFLVPNQVTTETVERLQDPQVIAQSPDRRFIAVAEGGVDPGVILYDTRSASLNVLYQLEPVRNGAFESMTFSPDSESLLLEINMPGLAVNRWQVVDIRNAGSMENTAFETDLVARTAEFSRDSDHLYFLNGGDLQRLSLDSGVRATLSDGVQAFTHRRNLVYAVKEAGPLRHLVELRGGRETLIKTLGAGRGYRLELIDYDDELNLMIHEPALEQVTLLDLEGEDYRTKTLPPFSAQEVILSPRHRFIAMREGTRISTYDLDRSVLSVFTVSGQLSSTPTWFDEHHLLVTGRNTIKLVEFDGGNPEELVSVEPGYPGFGDPRERLLFSVGRSTVDDGLWLQVSNLK